jgi:hypothetical protein
MADIKITIKNPTDAAFTWDGSDVPLARSGTTWTATVTAAVGSSHIYVITAWGTAGQAWTGTVAAPSHTNKHAGHMSPGGFDTTGDTAFKV